MKHFLSFLALASVLAFPALAKDRVSSDKAKAWIATNNGSLDNFSSEVQLAKPVGQPTVVSKWEHPTVPMPNDPYWDTLSDGQAKKIVKDYEATSQPEVVKSAANELVEALWQYGTLDTNSVYATEVAFLGAVDVKFTDSRTLAGNGQQEALDALTTLLQLEKVLGLHGVPVSEAQHQ